MFGFESRSGGWFSIATCIDHWVTPLGNCSVRKSNERRQYEKEKHFFNQFECKAESVVCVGHFNHTCNTDQLLGRVSHVSLST